MAGYTCPYCNQVMAISNDSMKLYRLSFGGSLAFNDSRGSIDVRIYQCPACDKISVDVRGSHGMIGNSFVGTYPNLSITTFPDYIPQAIRNDYEEASRIVALSPKASATLARRCLQGMIRDFHKIRKNTLYEEISELHGKIPEMQWKAIDSLRRVGNIGAHMEKDVNLIVDVEPDEASKLIKLIELLLEKWYIARHEEEALLNEIIGMADAKTHLRTHPPV